MARRRTASPRELIAAVLADFEDDAPLRVYADYLIEQGDPQGEFIALKLEEARAPKNRRFEFHEKAQAIYEANAKVWQQGVSYVKLQYQRGLATRLQLQLEDLPKLGKVLATKFPFARRLQLMWGQQVRRQPIPDRLVAPLLKLTQIRELVFLNAAPSVKALESLLNALALEDLSLSRVNGNSGVGDAGATLIATTPRSQTLRTLQLIEQGITDVGAQAIASSPHLTALDDLGLFDNPITRVGGAAIGKAFTRAKLWVPNVPERGTKRRNA